MINIRRANERGHADHGWLDSYHTFSFADYHDPEHMGFHSLRVINEDRVTGGEGFGTHPHRDFEIISYIVSGALRHQDSMGSKAVMRAGEIQRISAGTGIAHSEYNDSPEDPVHFLQIWLFPSQRGVRPNYAQLSLGSPVPSGMTLVCSPEGRAGSLSINQDADLFVGRLDAAQQFDHQLRRSNAWVQLISGDLTVNGQSISAGDGAAVEQERELKLASKQGAHFVAFDLE